MSEAKEFYKQALKVTLGLSVTRALQKIHAAGHRWTYRQTATPKNVVIIGGSYAGTYLAQRLSETLPTGYKAVLIERNTHFNHLFVFPRFSVVPNKEHMAFVPYDGLSTMGPEGIFEFIHDSATGITENQVQLASGKTVDYEYLAMATGTWQPPPSKASSPEKSEATAELRASQDRIHDAKSIAIIGGGPVGIQIATDIASFFPGKDITLIHSRAQLLPNFGPKLHEHTLDVLKRLNVKVMLGERPQLTEKGEAKDQTLTFKDGHKSIFDLVIPCTGARPNSSILEKLVPGAICPTTRSILVRPTLQIEDPSNPESHIFALGDVSKAGPNMGRSARVQADVVTSNILSMINKYEPATNYKPAMYEGIIKLMLGKHEFAFYGQDEAGKEMLVNGRQKSDDLEVERAWANLNAKFEPTRG